MDYHDMLAHLGVGSAHPGGFAATINFLSHFPIAKGTRILEVGCGTGRTSCYLAKEGGNVTGLDVRPKMLETAKKRADREGVKVDWVEGDIHNLPFESGSFDAVFAESVTVFGDIETVLKEYYRVLAPGGELYDREMAAMKAVPKEMQRAIKELYGVKKMPSVTEWLDFLKQAGFREEEVWNPTALADDIYQFIQMENGEFADEGASDEQLSEVEKISLKNRQVMKQYEEYHGYGVFMACK
ncbi:MAG TPA: class I SAM-dependent methyltransferase [Bacillales bacterium]